MNITKLDQSGVGAKSKEFTKAQIAKPVKVRYGTYSFPVPISQYNDESIQRILTSFINSFASEEEVRVVVEDVRDPKTGYRMSSTEMTVHVLPPLTKSEKEDLAEQDRDREQRMKELEAARVKQIKAEKAAAKRNTRRQMESRDIKDEPKKKKAKKKTTKAKTKKKTVRRKKKPVGDLKPLTLDDILGKK